MRSFKWVTIGFGAAFLVALGSMLNADRIYYMAAILLSLPCVSYAVGWYTLRGLKAQREMPPSAWEGEEAAIIYAVSNATRIPRFFLAVQEDLPAWIEPLDPEPPLFNVGAGETTRVAYKVRFRKRGVYPAKAFGVTAIDPLGVVAFTRSMPGDEELVVYPSPRDIQDMPLSGMDRYGWQELTTLVFHGSSVDPDGVRPYTPGDPLRRVHWRQTARTGQLNVIEFEEAQSLQLVIALDLQRGTDIGVGTETTLEYAVRMAAALTQQAIQRGASVRMLVPPETRNAPGYSGSLEAVATPQRGQEQLFLVLDALARVQAIAHQSVSGLVEETVGILPPGTTLLVITARADGALPGVLARYTATGANVIVLYIDPETFPGGKGTLPAGLAQQFQAELLAVRAQPFVLRGDRQGDLYPEAVVHSHARHTQTI